MDVKQQILDHKIIAILRNIAPRDILPTAQALYEGGIRLLEVTFNQQKGPEDTVEAIKALCKEYDGKMSVGAGTVITKQQAQAAVDAGAKYMISPNTNIEVIKYTKERGALSIPGVFTPSEIIAAYEAGADFVKLFPAEVLGIPYIKAVTAPINHIPMLAVGGVDDKNLGQFLAAGVKGAGIGSNIVNAKLIKEQKFSELTALAKKYTDQI